jgi:hypothetical protein
MGKVGVLLPSRERAGRVGKCIQSFQDTIAFRGTTLFLLLDRDDPQLADYRRVLGHNHDNVVALVGEPMRCCPKLSWGWEMLRHGNVLWWGFVGDDVEFKTPWWDRRMVNEIREGMKGWGIVYPKDEQNNERHPTHYLMSANIPENLGYFAYPGLLHLWVDAMVAELGRATGLLRYVSDVVWEHVHYANNKAPYDHRYDVANGKESWDTGKRIFEDWRDNGGLARDVEKLRTAMGDKCGSP